MTWQFYGGTVDPAKKTIENMLFAFAMEPDKVGSMLDDLELKNLPPDKAQSLRKSIDCLKEKRSGIIVGREKLAQIHKQKGDRFKLTEHELQGHRPRIRGRRRFSRRPLRQKRGDESRLLECGPRRLPAVARRAKAPAGR